MAQQVERFVPTPYVLHKKKPVSDVCENGFVEYFYSKNNPSTTEVLDFVVEGNAEHLIMPSQTYIKITAELTGREVDKAVGAPGDTVHEGAKVSVINNILQSMFESVDVLVANQATTKTDKNYGYSALLQTLCNYGESSLDTYFELSGWAKDAAGFHDYMSTSNEGFKKRRELFKGTSCRVELIGKIFSPLFFQEKALPTQVSLRILLKKMNQDFILLHPQNSGKFELKIVDAVLMVQKVAVMPALRQSYIQLLDEGLPIPYFLKTPSFNYHTLLQGSTQYVKDNLFLGKIPNRVVIGMVATDAYHGAAHLNPYHFQHFDLSEICMYKDGSPYPRPMIKLDIANDVCADAYHNFMTSLHAAYSRHVPPITMEDFKNGYTLFSYDMSPDQLGSLHPGSVLNMNSNIRLEMRFSKPLPKNVNVMIYYEMDHLMEIHRDRRVTVEF